MPDRIGTRDWDAAHRAVADAYFPHELTPLHDPDAVNLTMQTVELGGITIGRLNWGADVAIACEYPGAYEVNIPLTGRLHSRTAAGADVVSTPGTGTIFAAGRAAEITRWTADCNVIGVKFDAEHLAREADRVHAAPISRRLSLPDQIDVASDAGASWFSLVRSLSAQLREPVDLLANPLVGPQLASAVTTAFLLAITPDDAADHQLRPRMVTRVLDAIHDDPAYPWTLAEMAAHGETSVRRLQEAFADYLQTTPTKALADIRLDAARADLEAGHVTVADVAARWGFSSPSRFAASFRRKFGVPPSELLR